MEYTFCFFLRQKPVWEWIFWLSPCWWSVLTHMVSPCLIWALFQTGLQVVQARLQRPFLGMSRTFAEMSRLHRTFYWTDVSEFSKGMDLPFYRLFKRRQAKKTSYLFRLYCSSLSKFLYWTICHPRTGCFQPLVMRSVNRRMLGVTDTVQK